MSAWTHDPIPAPAADDADAAAPPSWHAFLAVLIAAALAVVVLGLLAAAASTSRGVDAPSTGGAPSQQAPRPSVQPVPLDLGRAATVPASLLR